MISEEGSHRDTEDIPYQNARDESQNTRKASNNQLPQGLHSGRAVSSNQGQGNSFPRFNIIPSIFGRGSGNEAVEFLDEAGYIAAATVKPGSDAYARNKFNQVESDRIPSNRAVPDTRNQM